MPVLSGWGRSVRRKSCVGSRGADVLAAPSLHGESFGIVLLEGMAAGAAVVASMIPGYANVARPSRDALLVPPGDAGSLATAPTRGTGRRAGNKNDARVRLRTGV